MIENKAILIGLETPTSEYFKESLEELATLAFSAGYETKATFIQKGTKPTPNFYIGSGKVVELKQLIGEHLADVVIFDNELSPVHFRNLEAALDIKVLDRTMLILEIFERRAHSPVAKLQVSLARDQYMLPRLIGRYRELSRQRGATGTIGGPGEQKLELERRRLHANILRDRKALAKLVTQRSTQRKKRQEAGMFTVAIVGYTNSGKSTLLNRLYAHSLENTSSAKQVLAQDLLFSSLDTAARLIVLPNHRRFIAIDTIGFIRNMPPHLVAAFRSTLEEIELCDLIVYVVDYANPEFMRQLENVEETIEAIVKEPKPELYVFNKVDVAGYPDDLPFENLVSVSALKDIGFKTLEEKISRFMDDRYIEAVVVIPYTEPDLYSSLQRDGHIIHADYGPQVMTIDVELPRIVLGKYQNYLATTKIDEDQYHRS